MEKEADLFQDLNPEQRAKALADICTAKGSEKLRDYYCADEKVQMKDFVAEEGINLMQKKEEFAQISKDFREGIKQYESGIKDALINLQKGYSEKDQPIYMVDDQDAGIMKIYDEKGVFRYSRKLHPEEKQLTALRVATAG